MKTLYFTSVLFASFGIPLAADLPVDGYTKAFDEMADKFGLWATVTVVLMGVIIVTTWLRERRMAKRIDALETQLVQAIATNKDVEKALSAQTEVLKSLSAKSDAQVDVLKEIKIVFSQKICPFNMGTNKG